MLCASLSKGALLNVTLNFYRVMRFLLLYIIHTLSSIFDILLLLRETDNSDIGRTINEKIQKIDKIIYKHLRITLPVLIEDWPIFCQILSLLEYSHVMLE